MPGGIAGGDTPVFRPGERVTDTETDRDRQRQGADPVGPGPPAVSLEKRGWFVRGRNYVKTAHSVRIQSGKYRNT